MTVEVPQRYNRFAPRKNATTSQSQGTMRLSLVLIGVAVILALGVTSWLGFLSPKREPTLEIQEIHIVEAGEIELTGARYRGVLPSGRPYEITAKQAKEAQDGSGRVNMLLPTTTLTVNSGATVKLRSNQGVFNKGSDLVDLAGDVVVIQHGLSLRLDTEVLHANLKSGDMHSNVPVVVRDSNRRINANGIRIYNNGERIVFEGNAKMIMHSEPSAVPMNLEIKS